MVRAVSLGLFILVATEAAAHSVDSSARAAHRSRSGGSATADVVKPPTGTQPSKKIDARARLAPDSMKTEDASSAEPKSAERKIPLSRSGGSASRTYNSRKP